MTLATADIAGNPSARIVLLKGADENGFTFFTNYESQKGKDLAARPQAALLFHWHELERQVRIQGMVERVSPEMEFWQGRPSRLHDRIHYKLDGVKWVISRLAP